MIEVFRFESFVTCTFNQRGGKQYLLSVHILNLDWVTSTLTAFCPPPRCTRIYVSVCKASCSSQVSYHWGDGRILSRLTPYWLQGSVLWADLWYDTLVDSNLGGCNQIQTFCACFLLPFLWPPWQGSDSSCALKGLIITRLSPEFYTILSTCLSSSQSISSYTI